MSEKDKVKIVNAITASRVLGTFLLPTISSILTPLGTAIYIGSLWLTDAVDGYLARKWKVSTIFGANLDAFSDKLLGIAILIYLRTFFPSMIIPLIAEFSILGVNWHYGRKGADVKSSKLGKKKTVLFGITATLAVLSTLSLTSVLASVIPTLITLTSCVQIYTLADYVSTHKKYLKTHKPKNDVSHLGIIETIKAIIKLLGDEKIYSPNYYKEHKDEPLLDMLLNKKEESKTEELTESKQNYNNEEDYKFDKEQENELKIVYCLNYNEIQKLEEFAKKHKLDPDLIITYLSKYINTYNPTDYPTISEMENFIIEEEKNIEKTKAKKKS